MKHLKLCRYERKKDITLSQRASLKRYMRFLDLKIDGLRHRKSRVEMILFKTSHESRYLT